MIGRRSFLREAASATGLLFVGCSLRDLAAQSATGSRRATPDGSVAIRHHRVRTIDIHAHCVVPKAAALRTQQVGRQPAQTLEGESLSARLAHMDAQRIDMQVLSINPNWYELDRDLVTQIVAVQNETLADFCAAHSDRFVALASVALQFPDLAVVQLEEGIKRMGLRGAAIGATVAGRELSDPAFHSFWAKAEELGTAVFIHPQPSPEFDARLKGNGNLTNVIWNPLETTIALSHLIFEGTLDRFPGVKICAAHGGGYLPSYMHRSDHGCQIAANGCTPGVPKQAPTEYLKRLYYDSLVFTPEGLRHLAAEVGAGRIMVGTDYPFPWVQNPIEHVLRTPGLSDADREAILGGTAATLFGIGTRSIG